ncbi:high frequency lysogenization protein HflD [Stutzerimonas kirkiae]|uniref:High frequency lysogenization protein HflD homolog n=1 Tax=Stutzerimonas kirkiae TaxID=2211392 RepID=A0A4Q9RCH4_9GAMM|nr:high frequency lysogenization protein HflD [Stutzerimonas kirkiae]TBU98860.1 lysogenization regulator HflD [Stutzerimonas kirkiae]TBV03954.1 lysogenization regulator HflD [Stutzerimonas kirkiae]TBV09635.1 lysogenization regulator HflD [Stutzerimonas kirkiae]TBV16832.1 lysogenization regulator HflD [Stutzerimonas kirkiae]
MSTREQMIALGAVFEAAILVDRVAKTGQTPSAALECMLRSLMIRDHDSILDIYGGDDLNLRDGYRALAGTLERDTDSLQRDPLRYALGLIGLERQLVKREDMLKTIGSRLDQVQFQIEHFGLLHDNVISSLGGLYQDTISTLRQRIQVQGDMRFLQQHDNAAKIRALLLAGIRAVRLWRQVGGHRWHMIVCRGRLLKALYPLMDGHQ